MKFIWSFLFSLQIWLNTRNVKIQGKASCVIFKSKISADSGLYSNVERRRTCCKRIERETGRLCDREQRTVGFRNPCNQFGNQLSSVFSHFGSSGWGWWGRGSGSLLIAVKCPRLLRPPLDRNISPTPPDTPPFFNVDHCSIFCKFNVNLCKEVIFIIYHMITGGEDPGDIVFFPINPKPILVWLISQFPE